MYYVRERSKAFPTACAIYKYMQFAKSSRNDNRGADPGVIRQTFRCVVDDPTVIAPCLPCHHDDPEGGRARNQCGS
jgi:hypothetical protein